MKNLTTIPTLLLSCAALALVAATTVARTTPTPTAIAHHHVAGVSDPDPSDCAWCGGDPKLHVRALWTVQKKVASIYVMRFL